MEIFYSIDRLSTQQLRELFSAYRDRGWVDYAYYKLIPEGVVPTPLSDEIIEANIKTGNPHTYFVFMAAHEDEKDGIMIGFGLTAYPSFGAYLHLGVELLDEIVEKYGLEEKPTGEYYPFPGDDVGRYLN